MEVLQQLRNLLTYHTHHREIHYEVQVAPQPRVQQHRVDHVVAQVQLEVVWDVWLGTYLHIEVDAIQP